MIRHPLRVLLRFCLFIGLVTLALMDAFFSIQIAGKAKDHARRARWLQKWSKRILVALKIHCGYQGLPPGAGILACNHLSYLDILVLASRCPMVFVAKREVRGWPLIGWCTRCAGTLFIDRHKKADVLRLAEQFNPIIQQGVLLGLFLEGTSSDGRQVLPFRSSLLAPAEGQQWPVAAACISYSLADGSVENDICYWRDMTFFPHFLNLLSKAEIQADVVYQAPLPAGLDRKTMAESLHKQTAAINLENRSRIET